MPLHIPLEPIYAGSGWTTAAVTTSDNMFRGTQNIVGSMGTTYDVNHMDAEYARIDGGPQNPGYLSEKLDYIIGDVSGDGRLTISDVTLLIDLLLYGDMNGNAAADVNRDGIVNLSDLTALIDLLQGIN